MRSYSRVFGNKIMQAFFVALFLVLGWQTGTAQQPVEIPMSSDHWTTVMGNLKFVDHMGKPAMELQAGDYQKGIPEGVASVKDLQFVNGTIEYDVSAENGMGASVAFRESDKDSFEMFYLRPKQSCAEAPDCVQYAPQVHGVLLWDVFPQYQGPAPLRSGQWNHVKLVISGKRMNVFINGSAQPTLKIGRLEGDTDGSNLMLVGPGFFANLSVRPNAVEGLPSDPEPDATAKDDRYLRRWQISAFSQLTDTQAPTYAELPGSSAKWDSIEAERAGLVNVTRVYGLPGKQSRRCLVWLKTTIHSNVAQEKHASLGWAREVWVFVNGQIVYADKNLFQPPAARKSPDGRLALENGSFMLPLEAGENELVVAVADDFYGWGIEMHLDDLKDVVLNH